MKPITKQFLELLFDKGEEVCVSPNKFAYQSIKQEDIGEDIRIISNNENNVDAIREEDINLISINPIKGPRNDSNVTAFRTFLIEIDGMPLQEQQPYVDSLGLPYSACIFSGNKSLHFAVVLENTCRNIKEWRLVNKWLLNIISKADQQTQNPSRCIRFPDNIRHDGKRAKQVAIKLGNRISQDRFLSWINQFRDKYPKETIKKPKVYMETPAFIEDAMPSWLYWHYENGVHENRNVTWHKIVSWFIRFHDFDEDSFINMWDTVFQEEHDFPRKEWEYTIRSAFQRYRVK